MKTELYEENCGRCVHATWSADTGTVCGLTGAKPAFSGWCRELVIDPSDEAHFEIRDYRRRLSEGALEGEAAVQLSEITSERRLRDSRGNVRWGGIMFGIVLGVVLVARALYELLEYFAIFGG
nr:hypothetical protein [Candidatus Krumholzibacteria bacterium]